MCVIIAYIKICEAVSILIAAFDYLQYRGYDSAGVAILQSDGRMVVVKKVGKVKILNDVVTNTHLDGTCGIGHTRWATHGTPSDDNSHPHTSGTIALVHNGIIDCSDLQKKQQVDDGYVFKSETDTEVIAHLIHQFKKNHSDLSLTECVALALREVNGSFAICVIDSSSPDVIVGASRDSTLIIGES